MTNQYVENQNFMKIINLIKKIKNNEEIPSSSLSELQKVQEEKQKEIIPKIPIIQQQPTIEPIGEQKERVTIL